MPQLTLYAPDISCDHCIATIRQAVDAQAGARFLAGDVEARCFTVDVDGGATLDRLASVLAEEGYPLGEAGDAPVASNPEGVDAGGATHPEYRLTATEAGADINYDCPCGCIAGFAYNRALAEQRPESCCCGRTILVGRRASERLATYLQAAGNYEFDLQIVTMPWGQPLDAALATPARVEH
jgi:copper chaperone CopZ